MAFWTQLGLLMWKNLQMHRRGYVATLCEVVLPIIFAILIVKLRNLAPLPKKVAPVYYTEKPVLNPLVIPKKPSYKYVPNTKLVREIMSRVVDKLRFIYPNDSSITAQYLYDDKTVLQGFDSERELEEYFAKDHSDVRWTAVVFEGLCSAANSLPNRVIFTLRPKYIFVDENGYSANRFKNDYEYPAQPPLDYTEYSFNDWEMLHGLVGEALISLWAGKNVFLDLRTRQIPFPEWVNDQAMVALEDQLPFFLLLSFIASVFNTTKAVIYEKEFKLKEAMKLMGLNSAAYWLSWFLTFAVYLSLTMGVYALVLGVELDEVAIFREIDFSLLYVFLLCYASAIMTYGMMMSVFFMKATIGAAMSGGVFFLTFVPYQFIKDTTNYWLKMVWCLFFNTAAGVGVTCMTRIYHKGGGGVTWENFHEPTWPDTVSLFDVMMALVFDTFLHLLIMWYFDNIKPGAFGIPKHYLFFLTKTYWFGAEQEDEGDDDHEQHGQGNVEKHLFEKNPTHLKAGLRLCNLRKVYGDGKVAVEGLTINMYEGHITVLLGHNGAGKTSTMFMLTGFHPPTSGTAYIDGYNIRTDLKSARSSLGLCPQHDILFRFMTVEQHLYFFARLKGCPANRLKEEVDAILEQTGLDFKRYCLAHTLSGGQKRRLSIGIAFINGSKVVILDEPTSGVDPTNRRQIWDLLQRNRVGRTLMLSTHFMDEADALGNRIGIMAEGKLVCCGTPLFLKRLCGAGYHLVIVKQPDCVTRTVSEVIKRMIENAKLKRQHKDELMYVLPDGQVPHFPRLFRELDKRKEELGIKTFGASATTMEDVFLRLGSAMTPAKQKAAEERAKRLKDDEVMRQNFTTIRRMTTARLSTTLTPAPLLKTSSESVSPSASETETDVSDIESEKNAPEAEVAPSPPKVVENPSREQRCSTMSSMREEFSMSLRTSSSSCILLKEPQYIKLKGIFLHCSRLRAIIAKKYIHLKRRLVAVCIQMLMPAVFALIALLSPEDTANTASGAPVEFKLEGFSNPIVTYMASSGATSTTIGVAEHYAKLFPSDVKLLELKSADGSFSRQMAQIVPRVNIKYLIGADFQTATPVGLQATAFHNGFTYNTEPIAVNYILNAYAHQINSTDIQIRSGIKPFPVPKAPKDTNALKQAFHTTYRRPFNRGPLVGRYVSLGMAFMVTLFVHPLVMEQAVGAKHMQVLSGIGPFLFWITNLIFDYAIYCFPAALCVAAFSIIEDPPYTHEGRLTIVATILFIYGWAIIPNLYLFHFFFSSAAAGTVATLIYCVLSGPTISYGLSSIDDLVYKLVFNIDRVKEEEKPGVWKRVNTLSEWYGPLDYAFMAVTPTHCLATALRLMGNNYKNIHFCRAHNFRCDKLESACCNNCSGVHCLAFDISKDYMGTEMPGVGTYVYAMAIQGFVYYILTLLVETDVGQILMNFFSDPASGMGAKVLNFDQNAVEDSDVAEERERINRTPTEQLIRENSLLLINLYKQFGDFAAVKKVCVGVPEQECFGLLGQNGAGKTTIFKMLTGDMMATDGNAYLKGSDIKNNIHSVQSNIGYCPQFDAIHELMTARETLTMYARLRGIPEKYIRNIVSQLMDFLTLTPHADKPAGRYSGGNKRKLSTAMALVGDPHFVLLDEPSSGMDPGAMRYLWNVLSKVRDSGKTLVLTSHSMEECEALCTRIAIMVNGRFMCLGSTQHLKNKFGQGYTLITKMAETEEGRPLPPEPLVRMVQTAYPSSYIFDEHEGYVHLQIPDKSVKLADVFELMEQAKRTLSVQYYIVQQTTLEQVFLSFTRQQLRPTKPLSGWYKCFHSCCCCLATTVEASKSPEDATFKREHQYLFEAEKFNPGNESVGNETAVDVGAAASEQSVAESVAGGGGEEGGDDRPLLTPVTAFEESAEPSP